MRQLLPILTALLFADSFAQTIPDSKIYNEKGMSVGTRSFIWTDTKLDTVYINDESPLSHCFNTDKSKMVDSSTTTFKTAKQNVLKYCNSNYDFLVDTCGIDYSCREYFSVNTSSTDKYQARYKKEKLKYEFFITLRIKPTVYYYLSFILDTALQVKDASPFCQTVGAKKIWTINGWSTYDESIKKYKNGYITPIDYKHLEIEFDKSKKCFIYVVQQATTNKTKFKKVSDYLTTYEVNELIVDASTGQIIKEKKATFRIISDPPF